jgi:hypothetical protein
VGHPKKSRCVRGAGVSRKSFVELMGRTLARSHGCQGITFMRTAAATMTRMRIMSKVASGRLLSTLSTVANNNKTAKQMAIM